MAAAKPSVSMDQCTCSVCLEVLREPVTIPCGHSYCLKCINRYWSQTDRLKIYRCPQCRRVFSARPELNRNTILAELIEKLKEAKADVSPSHNYTGPDGVCCDVCPGRKLSAVKTCLTCMASYCEAHLQPHRQSEALKRHKLEEPTGNLEEKLCPKHQKVLEMFCRTDESCVCSMCAATEHKSHDTVTLDMERAERQSQLKKRKAEMKKKVEEKETKLREMKDTIVRIQSSADTEVQELEETFTSVLESIKRLRSEVAEVIRDYEQKEVRKTEELMEQLEKEIEELKRRDAELAELSKIDDHIHFMKKLPSFCDTPKEDTSNIAANGDFIPETLRKDLSDLKRSLEELSGWEFVKRSEAEADDPCQVLQNLRSRNYLLKHSCPVTLDLNTAHRHLRLSQGNKKVTHKEMETPYPDHPDRFDFWLQVLCRETLSGTRCYWEAEWSGNGVAMAVTYKGISRKGRSDKCVLGFNEKSWCLICSESNYSVRHNNLKTQISAPYSHRIGVYLDCPSGSLSFYSISDTMTLIHKFKTSFTEPLYPAFGFNFNSSVTICPL
ncbi:tripartite motif-containing protein 16-like isoform X1 [Erpetoichthys calabaricus]|uniref:tripartite motif-containing protein 16-like isoform X1 n=1 Tax=Erpetoichthys calabaricus TaxID=27687 RepID=UPI002234971B|nr:tripartite motif-containing protein 16-like isoform X1 [Erpetoichthys calabaricus]